MQQAWIAACMWFSSGVVQMNVFDDRNEDSGLVIPLRLVAVNGWGVYSQKHPLPLQHG